jgi:predicted transcriptional regulator
MSMNVDLSPDLSARVDALAKRRGTSRAEIIRDALELGRSLDWQEEWLRRVEAGIAAAEKGDFVDDAEIFALLSKYR